MNNRKQLKKDLMEMINLVFYLSLTKLWTDF